MVSYAYISHMPLCVCYIFSFLSISFLFFFSQRLIMVAVVGILLNLPLYSMTVVNRGFTILLEVINLRRYLITINGVTSITIIFISLKFGHSFDFISFKFSGLLIFFLAIEKKMCVCLSVQKSKGIALIRMKQSLTKFQNKNSLFFGNCNQLNSFLLLLLLMLLSKYIITI